MFWMFLINTIGITLMWVAFWFLLIITQKGGKTSDKSQSFQLWLFCSCCKLGDPGKRMIVRSTLQESQLVALGETGRFLRLFAPRCCPAAWKLLHGLPGVPSFGTIVRYLARCNQFCQGICSSLHAQLPQIKNYCSVSDRARCRTSDFGVGVGAARCCSACCTSPPSLRTLAENQQI